MSILLKYKNVGNNGIITEIFVRVDVDLHRPMRISVLFLVRQATLALLHGLNETLLVNERDEHDGFPILLLPVLVRLFWKPNVCLKSVGNR